MLAKRYAQTIAQLEQMQATGVVPALSYVIFDGDQRVAAEKGFAQLEPEKQPLRPGMYYDLASLTKVVATTPTLCQLEQAGKLSWDDPVSDYLPELGGGPAQIRDLLTHSAAIEGYIPHRDQLNQSELLAALLGTEKFGANLGLNIAYTDLGLIFAGLIAERLTGTPIQELATKLVLAPLGLANQLTYHPDPAQTVPTAIAAQRGLIVGVPHDPKAAVLKEHCGSAGLFGTLEGLEDYAKRLLTTNLDGLVSPANLDRLFSDQTRLPGEHNRALGWKLMHTRGADRHPVATHTGFTGTFIVLDRVGCRGMIVLTNRVHPTAKNDAFLDARDQIFATYLNELG